MTTYLERMTVEELESVLIRNGFVRCDIPACNCGSWHARYGLRERLDEIKDALAEAGHPLCNENGNLALAALKALITERDELARRLEEAQQKIVAQQVKLDNAFHLTFSEKGNPLTDNVKINLIRDLLRCGDFESLAAHDAELTAKAKAEALEEAINKCFDMTLYTGFDCAIALEEMAAEYRAGRKE